MMFNFTIYSFYVYAIYPLIWFAVGVSIFDISFSGASPPGIIFMAYLAGSGTYTTNDIIKSYLGKYKLLA